jgi:acylpyruvate hydrolase
MKILCIGRNYADHIKELANERPDQPVVFLKPETALVENNKAVAYPEFTNDLHHEAEIVLRVSKEGRNIPLNSAFHYFDSIGIGVDFTARDLQSKQKAKGLPWEIAKSFDQSAPVSVFLPVKQFQDIKNLSFMLKVNGVVRQNGNTCDMMFSFDEIISYCSRFFTLLPGDLIFTGTPAGVGPVSPGDHLEAFMENIPLLDFKIV